MVGTVRRSERKATHALSRMYQNEKGARAPRESGGCWQRIGGIWTSLRSRDRSERWKLTIRMVSKRRVRLAFGSNALGKQQANRSRRSCRDPQRLYARHHRENGDEPVRSSWRHGELGRNDLALISFGKSDEPLSTLIGSNKNA